jgi:hypothetical protein
MVTWLPPGRSFIKDAIETPEEGKARYERIADAAIAVAYDPDEKPIFGGKYGRAKTLALILSIAYFESGYRKDVDLNLGPLARGDKGESWCMMQFRLGRPSFDGDTKKRVVMDGSGIKWYSRPVIYEKGRARFKEPPEGGWPGWGGKALVSDRHKCFTAGLHFIRKSFNSCRHLPIVDRLSVYGAGRCLKNMQGSRIRVVKAQKWLAHSKPPLTDKEVMELLHPDPDPEDAPVARLDIGIERFLGISGESPYINMEIISKGRNTRPVSLTLAGLTTDSIRRSSVLECNITLGL